MSRRRNPEEVSRRDFCRGALAAGAGLALVGCAPLVDDGGQTASVAILRGAYDADLVGVIRAGFDLAPPPPVAGRRVLLKPNLVDLPREGRPATTHPAVVLAAVEAFRALGAAEVIVGDGPALQRDGWEIADAIGLSPLLADAGVQFVDLNHDELVRVENLGGNLGLEQLYYSRSVVTADVIVSMPKMKVHHWLGVSLSMKNMFGTLSSLAYGWPRNMFHIRGPHNAILDFNLTRPADYAIVDGIVGMEGDGPIHGTAVDVGVLVMGANSAAVDATSARIMGLRPESIEYLRRAAGLIGPVGEAAIAQLGEPIAAVQRPFQLLAHQSALSL